MMRKVLLTHSQGRLQGLNELLTDKGFDVKHQPLIQTSVIHNGNILIDAEALLSCEWMLFTSQAAIEAWIELGLGFPKNMGFGAVGQKTAKRLEALGVEVNVIGEPQDAQGLAEVFIQNYADAKTVALPKGNLSLSILDDKLKAAGIETKPLVIYETQLLSVDYLKNEVFDVVFFASPSAVEAFNNVLDQEDMQYIAIGETTAKAIHDVGQTCTIAQTPIVEAIAEAIVNLSKQN